MSVTTFQLFPLTLRLKVVPRRRRWRGKKLIRFREDGETKGGSVARLSVYGGQRELGILVLFPLRFFEYRASIF